VKTRDPACALALYDCGMWVWEKCGLGRWRRDLVGRSGGRVLEVGIGTGRNLRHYPLDARVIGLDPDLRMLRRAARRRPDVPLVAGRAEALPFRADAFDAVVSSLVFCSVADPVAGLGEIRRVLGPDGRLHMLEHVRSTSRWLAWIQDLVQPVWTRVTGGCHLNRDTEALVMAEGFHLEKVERRTGDVLRRFRARLADHG
jgi:ubiquinone/menaquinone biosynthesis C-methylase UbiE